MSIGILAIKLDTLDLLLLHTQASDKLKELETRFEAENKALLKLCRNNLKDAPANRVRDLAILKDKIGSARQATAQVRLQVAIHLNVPHKYLRDIRIDPPYSGPIASYRGDISIYLGTKNGHDLVDPHGHYVINQAGDMKYRREPWEVHSKKNFLIK